MKPRRRDRVAWPAEPGGAPHDRTMPSAASDPDARSDLIGRRGELEAIDRFVERVRDASASVLVIGN